MSRIYKGGVSGIEPALNQLVWGVVYDVSENEIMYLDKIEGVSEGSYYRHTLIVVKEDGTPIKVYTYRTTNPKGPFKPTKKYLELIVNGAKAHEIDSTYISKLESIETVD
jgi:gamma-glutamylcyclotransferase